ncbi:MAG: hypothetical protein R2880_15265 [Deinococcales bacterium]
MSFCATSETVPKKVLTTYDEKLEASKLASSFQGAVVRSGLLQLGGVGLGAAMVAFLSGAALDITGVMAGLAVAGMGLLVLPNQRRKAKKELHTKMQDLRDGLEESLGKQFELELGKANNKLSEAISPYTRFVRSELGRLEDLREELQGSKKDLIALKSEIDNLI